MKNVLWIEKHRQHIFVLEILLAIVFGPGLAKILGGGFWLTAGMILSVFLILEVALTITRLTLAKMSHDKVSRTHDKMKAAHTQVKKDYTEMTGERLDNYRPIPKKKKRKKKGKKTHRK
jgi:hypothetical protein